MGKQESNKSEDVSAVKGIVMRTLHRLIHPFLLCKIHVGDVDVIVYRTGWVKLDYGDLGTDMVHLCHLKEDVLSKIEDYLNDWGYV